jgi:hypothetical protein
LPISNPLQDDIVKSTPARVIAAAGKLKPGTIMLINDPIEAPVAPGSFAKMLPWELQAIGLLQQRYRFETIERGTGYLRLVRLEARR